MIYIKLGPSIVVFLQKAKRWKESIQAKKEEKQRKKLGLGQWEGSGYKDIVKENQILEKYYKFVT